MKKKHLSTVITSVIGAFFITLTYLFAPPQTQSFDNALRDIFFQIRGVTPPTGEVTIVDIDEKSLAELGQWPWERDLVAKLLQKLDEDGAGIIGLDIVFAEADKTSPSYLNNKHQLNLVKPHDYDQILADTIATTPTILGYVFIMEQPTPLARAPSIPAIIIEKNQGQNSFYLQPKGVLPNLGKLQESAYSSGFFNNLPDQSGMVRNIPLIMKFNGVIYPSLSLEMLRIATQSPTIEVLSSENGIEHIKIGEQIIPTNRYGQLFLNYRGPGKTFKYISAIDILNGHYSKEHIQNKWVLIGPSALGLLDLRSTPFDNAYPGVEVHANVIDNILSGDLLSKPNWIEAVDLLIMVGVFLLSFILFNFLNALFIAISFSAIFVGLYLFINHMLFAEGIILNILMPFFALFFALILSTLLNYFFETRQKNLIKNKLASKVSPSVMDEILKNESLNIMQGQTREITIFFSDLRDFTHLSEIMPNPKTLIQFLNDYTTAMSNIIIQRQGTIDKYIGDAIMAYWNAPNSLENHADIALKASLEQLSALSDLNTKIKQNPSFSAVAEYCSEKGIEPVKIGIGLNTGDAVIGEMGSAGRSDYTVIGDTVNLGSRLESLCKFYGSSLNISGQTKSKLQDSYVFRFLDYVTVKGKNQPVEIWQVHGKGEADTALKAELDAYHQAIEHYQAAHFAKALTQFQVIQAWPNISNPKIYAIYIERCKQFIKHPPKDFDGIFEHNSKS
ncbi:MAG: adenylate/guanylate cyclase domain-containing protein [Thiomicrorhabdus sp.]|nr:adenylate/guanylate cyclase domain-containing protein [Thiomicrorhabdus sp.]